MCVCVCVCVCVWGGGGGGYLSEGIYSERHGTESSSTTLENVSIFL